MATKTKITNKKQSANGSIGSSETLIPVLKTYKVYIGGKFPRTESGRYYTPKNTSGDSLGNVCLCSRKDLRDAVGSARSAFGGWSGKTAFNRSQIVYRIAEMLEGRKAQFMEELQLQGSTKTEANRELRVSIDRIVHYAGWADKYAQVFSAVNPVASSHFNFSVPEPTGVVGIIAPQDTGLLGLVSNIIPAITGGNTSVVLASKQLPLCAVTFAEVLNSSDLPGGVVNILTGDSNELVDHFAKHMDVNALIYCGDEKSTIKSIQESAANNVKRVVVRKKIDWLNPKSQNPYLIMDTQEIKTTWHPIENIGGAKSGY